MTYLTEQHVTAECRRDMRPSVQLPSVSCSGADSKLGLPMVRPRLQPAPDPPALDRPPVSKHDALTFDHFQLKIGTPLTHALGNVCTKFAFSTFCFRVYEPVRDRRTDGQTDGRARRVMRPIGRPIGRPRNNNMRPEYSKCKEKCLLHGKVNTILAVKMLN